MKRLLLPMAAAILLGAGLSGRIVVPEGHLHHDYYRY
jgi:hypothetical protein